MEVFLDTLSFVYMYGHFCMYTVLCVFGAGNEIGLEG